MHRTRSWARWRFVVLMWLALILVPSQAWAFCGFFASSAKADVYNDVTQVALMRHGTTTVLSMRNTYKGPVKDFAMVVPVPQVLKKEDVKTLNDDLFDRLDKLTAPRLVDYFEEDPCAREGRTKFYNFDDMLSTSSSPVVEVKASFKVGEYDVEILSAKDSTKLESWLKANGYNIPKGASKALAPYIAQGMYFFVAKVDARKVKFDKSGEAMLSPLRFAYDSEDFTLPVRLGLLNSKGKQDLSVFLLSTDGRYEVSNYPNAFIPTNLVVKDEVRHNFSAFYDALLQRELDKMPGVVVTEYAWGAANKCDPCPPSGTLGLQDVSELGLDVIQRRHRRLNSLRWKFRETFRDDDVLDALDELKPAFKTCYERLDIKPESGAVVVTLSTREDGHVEIDRVTSTGLGDVGAEVCVRRALATLDVKAAPDSMPRAVTAQLEFSADKHHLSRVSKWTLTRLRARYSPKTMKDDLRFVIADAVRGGVGMPAETTPYFSQFSPTIRSASPFNQFQGRYAIVGLWEEELECKHPERGQWSRSGAESRRASAKSRPEPKGSTGEKLDPKDLYKYIISGPKELMSRAE